MEEALKISTGAPPPSPWGPNENPVPITSVFRRGKPDENFADNFLRACREGCGATALSRLTAMIMLIVFGGSGAE